MLSINIPTFNRPKSINKLFEFHKKFFIQYNVEVNIFDSSKNDETKKIYSKFKDVFRVTYYKNNKLLHPDENFYQSYYFVNNSEYVFLLGDTYKINEKLFIKLFNILKKKKYDIIVLNHASIAEAIDFESSDKFEFLQTVSSVSTCMSTLIFHKSIFQKYCYKKYLKTNFIHTAILFHYISEKKFKAYFLGTHSVERNFNQNDLSQKINWSYTDDIFNISIVNWTKFIYLLPAGYTREFKIQIFKNFYRDLKIFNFKRLIYLRYKGILNLNFILNYKSNFFDKIFNLKFYYFKILLFLIIPRVICGLIFRFFILFQKWI